uniref:Phosphopantothenoylcysteine decarboxylase n=1 Tax=Herpetomonas muscarum TaxID=5718 RepID=T1YTT6_HERMU|nr:phosphopantothenoylcysteine decarboxylase [Herpetomonas muscarum]
MSETPTTGSGAAPAAVAGSAPPIPPSINLLILITGSIAAVKTGLLLDQLHGERCNIRIAATTSAFHFLRRAQPSRTGIPFQSILTDEQEWDEWQAMNDAVVHIELRRWADLVLIAPLDANSLAKIATGQCNNLVTCVMRAWEVGQKPVIACPAMNTAMWTHPITATQIGELRRWYSAPVSAATPNSATAQGAVADATDDTSPSSPEDEGKAVEAAEDAECAAPLPQTLSEALFQVVGPVTKKLACGDVGMGGMASVEEIARYVRQTMALLRKEKLRSESANNTPAPPAPVGV